MVWGMTSAQRLKNSGDTSVATLLIVDSDPDELKSAALALGQDYPVLSSSSGQEALRIARNARPDVIILGASTAGGTDGFTTFCELRKNPETAHIKVLMLIEINKATKLQFSADAMKTYLGAASQAFLEKPINPQRLRQAVATMLGPAA